MVACQCHLVSLSNVLPTLSIINLSVCLSVSLSLYLHQSDIREQLYRAYITRASSGPADNSEIIKRILQIAQEQSHVLGYKNYAEQSLASKMATRFHHLSHLASYL